MMENYHEHIDDIKMPLADHSNIRRKALDVSYSNLSEKHRIDIYMPDKEGEYPLIAFIHGGAFMMCDKADAQVQPYLSAVKRGYVVASINYRLSSEAIFPAAVQDCKAAIRFLRANSKMYSIDPERIAVCGGSAGGNLAEMLCTSDGVDIFENNQLGNTNFSSAVQAGVSWFGPTDFLLMDEQLKSNNLFPQDHNLSNSPESRYLGGKITDLDYDYVQQANPMTYINKNMPPMLLQHGLNDHLVPYQQSVIFYKKAHKYLNDNRVELELLEDADHGDKAFETEKNMEKVFAFLDKVLAR